MPGARLMLNMPAASAAPVAPAHTSACARPCATARAACTIEASGVVRAAHRVLGLGDRHRRVHDLHARRRLAQLSAGPNSRTRAPCAAAIAAPAATSAGPRSAPLQSTATTGACARLRGRMTGTTRPLASLPASRDRARARDRARPRRHDLAARVCAAHRAHPMRPARAVALRTRVQRGRADLVLSAPLGGAAVRLLFLGDGHRRMQQRLRPQARRYSSSAPAASPSADRARARDGARGRPR